MHAQFAPSKAATWSRCHGALALAQREGVKDDPPSEYAASGTLTHAIAAELLQPTGQQPKHMEGTSHTVDGFTFTIDADRMARAASYALYVERESAGNLLFVEVPLRLNDLIWGTGDAIVAKLVELELHAHDLKDGVGAVYAEDNDQLITYLCAARREYSFLASFQKFVGWIHQPKLDYVGRVEYTAAELDEHERRLLHAADRGKILMSETPNKIRSALTPGDKQCKWCPMRGSCPARSQAIADTFPDLSQDTLRISAAERGALLAQWGPIKDFFDALFASALNAAKLGEATPGWKLAVGRQGNRAWANKQLAEAVLNRELAGDAYDRTLISPTTAEKKLKARPDVWTEVQSNIHRAEGTPTLVPEADMRPALPAMSEFGVVADASSLLGDCK